MESTKFVTTLQHSFDCKQRAVRAVRYNGDGNYCLTCGSDKTVKLWNPITSSLLKTYSSHGAEVLDAHSSSDNSQFCSCGLDKNVIVTDVASGLIARKFRGHVGIVNCCAFNDDSAVVLSGSIDGSVRVWDCKSHNKEPIQVMSDAKDSVTSIYVAGHEILTGSADSKVRRYDLRMGQMIVDYMGCTVSSVSFTRDGQCILTSSQDSTLRLVDKDTGKLLNEYTGHRNTEYKIDSCISSNDRHILSGSDNGQVFVWDLVQATVLSKLTHKPGRVVHSLSHHPSKAALLTASEAEVYLWVSMEPD